MGTLFKGQEADGSGPTPGCPYQPPEAAVLNPGCTLGSQRKLVKGHLCWAPPQKGASSLRGLGPLYKPPGDGHGGMQHVGTPGRHYTQPTLEVNV